MVNLAACLPLAYRRGSPLDDVDKEQLRGLIANAGFRLNLAVVLEPNKGYTARIHSPVK